MIFTKEQQAPVVEHSAFMCLGPPVTSKVSTAQSKPALYLKNVVTSYSLKISNLLTPADISGQMDQYQPYRLILSQKVEVW